MGEPATQAGMAKAGMMFLAASFNIHADAHARVHPEQLHHMYEWMDSRQGVGGPAERVGDPEARLWRVIRVGSGNMRTATYEFRASTKSVPRNENTDDTRQQFYVFHWKAAMLELGARVHVAPSTDGEGSGFLAFPVDQNYNHMAASEHGNMAFTRKAIDITLGQVEHGKFNEVWTEYFTVVAPGEADEMFRESFEREVPVKLEELYKTFNRPGTPSAGVGIKVITTPRVPPGRARRIVEGQVSGYVQQARQRKIIAGMEGEDD
jgi:hypothetical protein